MCEDFKERNQEVLTIIAKLQGQMLERLIEVAGTYYVRVMEPTYSKAAFSGPQKLHVAEVERAFVCALKPCQIIDQARSVLPASLFDKFQAYEKLRVSAVEKANSVSSVMLAPLTKTSVTNTKVIEAFTFFCIDPERLEHMGIDKLWWTKALDAYKGFIVTLVQQEVESIIPFYVALAKKTDVNPADICKPDIVGKLPSEPVQTDTIADFVVNNLGSFSSHEEMAKLRIHFNKVEVPLLFAICSPTFLALGQHTIAFNEKVDTFSSQYFKTRFLEVGCFYQACEAVHVKAKHFLDNELSCLSTGAYATLHGLFAKLIKHFEVQRSQHAQRLLKSGETNMKEASELVAKCLKSDDVTQFTTTVKDATKIVGKEVLNIAMADGSVKLYKAMAAHKQMRKDVEYLANMVTSHNALDENESHVEATMRVLEQSVEENEYKDALVIVSNLTACQAAYRPLNPGEARNILVSKCLSLLKGTGLVIDAKLAAVLDELTSK